MADFVRLRLESGAPVMVNDAAISHIIPDHNGRDDDGKIRWSNTKTVVSLYGTDEYLVIDEPFESVCAKLNRMW